MDRPGGLLLLPQAPERGAPRRRVRARFTLDHYRPASSRSARWRSCSSSSTCCGRCSTRCRSTYGIGPQALTEACRERAPCLPDRRRRIELHRQYRFQWEAAQQSFVLLYPEGMVQLPGSAGEIMKRVDGTRERGPDRAGSGAAFPGVDLRGDVVEFLEVAHGKGWIRTTRRSVIRSGSTRRSRTSALCTACSATTRSTTRSTARS